jgi:hypothetical protein
MSASKIVFAGAAAVLVAAGAATLAWRLPAGGSKAPPGLFLGPPDEFVADYAASETLHDQCAGSVRARFIKHVRERAWDKATQGLAKGFRGDFPSMAEGRVAQHGDVRVLDFPDRLEPRLDAIAFVAALREHVDGWVAVERAVFRVFEFRGAQDRNSAHLKAHFELAGPLPGGGRANLQGVAVCVAVRETEESWGVRDFGLESSYRVDSKLPAFTDVTRQAGLSFAEDADSKRLWGSLVDDIRQTTAGGVVVRDFNADGFPDVLATREHVRAEIFINDGHGGFRAESPPLAGPAEAPITWAVADLDGDGIDELVSGHVEFLGEGKAAASLYHRRGAVWEKAPSRLEFRVKGSQRRLDIEGIVPWDVDRDGRLDLYFCAYQNDESQMEKFNRIASYDGADNLLFMNQGGLNFSEESDARGIVGTQYTYVAQFFDFDFDGDDDLFEGNDYGPNILWENLGNGHFRENKSHPLAQGSTYTMGLAIGDYDNTGTWSVHVSNMYSHAGNRILPLAGALGREMKETALLLARGNQHFEWDAGSKAWVDRAVERQVNWADWAWACMFWDPDNDMDQDLWVANGYTSHSDKAAPDY